MKSFFLSLLLCASFLTPVVAAQPENVTDADRIEQLEGQLRARNETINGLVGQLRSVKVQSFSLAKKSAATCEEEERPERRPGRHHPTTCVPNCTWRSSSGSCLSYGSDFCGPNASCEENCTWRSSSGSCLSYGADICS